MGGAGLRNFFSFDRESKNPKQKWIKSKPIQQKISIKSNISYPNLKNRKKQCTGVGTSGGLTLARDLNCSKRKS